MPKYTYPTLLTSSQVIRSSDWNNYFGSNGNIRWAYDALNNVSASNAIQMSNAPVPATARYVPARITSWTSSSGNSEYIDTQNGVLTSPINEGYVFLTACVSHNLTLNTIGYAVQIHPVHLDTTPTLYTSFLSHKKLFNSSMQNSNLTSFGLWPRVQQSTISMIYQIKDGATKFRISVARYDAAIVANTFTADLFSLIPLGDVSGVVNFLDNVRAIE